MAILQSLAQWLGTRLSVLSSNHSPLLVAGVCLLVGAYALYTRQPGQKKLLQPTAVDDPNAPVSVNYFPSRECNYACGFCFHTDTSRFILPIEDAKRGLRLLKEAGMRKLNIAGGEPFLHPRFLAELLRYSKEDLRLESVSIVSNGSKIREAFLREHGRHLDILAISCDSFAAATNRAIGRGPGADQDGDNVAQLFRVAQWCRQYGVLFKLNTVVNVYNWDEDMADHVARLAPFRWKVFQCLIVEGENEDETRVRDARRFLVTDEQWQTFCGRHRHLPCYVPEDNQTMAGSYLLLDEHLRFMDKGDGPMKLSRSILDVGVKAAMEQVRWDQGAFADRGGIYEWSRPAMDGQTSGCGTGDKEALAW